MDSEEDMKMVQLVNQVFDDDEAPFHSLSQSEKAMKIATLVNQLIHGDEVPFYSLSDSEKVALWDANVEMPDTDMSSCALAFGRLGQWDKALVVADSIRSESEKYERLGGLAQLLVKEGLLERAESVISSIPIESGDAERVEAVVRLACALIGTGEIAKAQSLLLTEGAPTSGIRMDPDGLSDVAYAMAKAGSLEQAFHLWKEAMTAAKELLSSYPNDEESYLDEVKLLRWIPIACAEFGEYERAKELIRMLPEKYRDMALKRLSEIEAA